MKTDYLVMSPKEFMERFSLDELRAIYNHANEVVDVKIWLDRLTGASHVELCDQGLIDGMAYMVFQGLITQERHDAIMDMEE